MTNDELLKATRVIKKQYARRNIEGYRSPYNDSFEYRSTYTLGIDEICRLILMAPFFAIEPDTDSLLQARAEFDILVEHAGSAYAPEYWLVAFKDGNPVGYVFPQRYFDKMEEGSIFAIGVLPKFQGNGYGKVIHAKGLEMLAAMGVTSYVGSTEIENAPMIAIFLANGCELTKVHTIEVDENGIQRLINSK